MPSRSNRTSDEINRPSVFSAWLETVAITVGMPLFGLAFHSKDPFFLDTPFPWLVFAPLLPGLRYGFAYGFGSALALNMTIAIAWHFKYLPIHRFPFEFSVGLLAVGMLAGEFSVMWNRRMDRLAIVNKYHRSRLDEFSRAFHLLKTSHDRLEHQLSGSTQSLRESLLSMRKEMKAAKSTDGPLLGLGKIILGIFAGHCYVETATIYAVNKNTDLGLPAAATFGEAQSVDPSDPLVLDAIRTRQLVSVRSYTEGRESGDRVHEESKLLATVPLSDVSGCIHGLIAIQEIHFTAFNEENLRLMAVLGGHIGDILSSESGAILDEGAAKQEFMQQIKRSIEDAHHYDLPAMLLVIEFLSEQKRDITKLILRQRRGLDRTWVIKNRSGQPVILLIMPLTDPLGMEGYRLRLEQQIQEHYDTTISKAGLSLHSREIQGRDTVKGIYQYLRKVCRVDGD